MDPNECELLFNGSCYELEGENKSPPLEIATFALSAARTDLIHTGIAVLAKSRPGRKKKKNEQKKKRIELKGRLSTL